MDTFHREGDMSRQQWVRTLFTLDAIVTKLACFFNKAAAPAELAIYIDITVIYLAQTVLGAAMKKLRSLSVEAESLRKVSGPLLAIYLFTVHDLYPLNSNRVQSTRI